MPAKSKETSSPNTPEDPLPGSPGAFKRLLLTGLGIVKREAAGTKLHTTDRLAGDTSDLFFEEIPLKIAKRKSHIQMKIPEANKVKSRRSVKK